jgi:hypothetical protein
MRKVRTVYRLFDDHEEKHYVSSSLDHQSLEKLVQEYKVRKEKVYAQDFVNFLHEFDQLAEEVVVKDLYF